jgi:hypothetical protein
MDRYRYKAERQREIFSGEGAMPHTFIQWKGTDVCLDFHCKCGAHLHFDCEFLYGVHCEHCNRVYMMGDRVPAFDVTGTEYEAEVRENGTTKSGFDDDRDPEAAKRRSEAAAEWSALVERIQDGSMIVTGVSPPKAIGTEGRIFTGLSFTFGPKSSAG